jgi:uncharacterized protein (TIGR03663 family)
MTRGFSLWLLLAALLALGLRSVQLDSRPMHNDEAVNSIKFRNLWEGPGYRYDPYEYHGPTLAYSTLVWEKLTGAGNFNGFTEARLRSLTVLFGVGLVLLLFLVADGLGRKAALAAAILTATSPVMVYYSRDYIHETLFVFFIFLALASGWRYCQTGKIAWILLAGAALGLMQATKETFVFNIAAAMGALLLNECFRRPGPESALEKRLFKPAHLIAAGLAWAAVVAVLFTSFFANPSGLLDDARTYLVWFQRAKGASPHVHEWSFYWQRLLFFHRAGGPIWSEALILLLAVGAGIAAFGRRELPGASKALARFLVFYTVILAAIYTVMPYKTPWSALGFWHGAILLAGIGAAALPAGLRGRRLKMAAWIILFTGAAQLGVQAWQSAVNTRYSADPRNPWVYAQTLPNLLELEDKVDAVAEASPDGAGLRINVIAPDFDYWPLPWYLRRYGAAGYWENVPGYSKFAAGEIQDADGFVGKLRAQSDPVSRFLIDSGVTNGMDAAHPANGDPGRLESLLVTNLNQIIAGPSIYDSNRFQGIPLRSETRELLRQNPGGQDLIRLNRRLLEDAYPAELGTNNFSAGPYPPVTIVSARLEPDVDGEKAGIMTGYYEMRPGVWLELYVQSNLWSAYLEHRGNGTE